MLTHLKNMLARRSLPSLKTRTSEDWKKILKLTLIAGLVLSSVNIAAATHAPNKIEKTAPKKHRAKSTNGWSLKAKAIAALSIAASSVALYLAYKLKTQSSEISLQDILKYDKQNHVPAYQIPAGRAGQLMHNIIAHSEPCHEAMQNPVSRGNIEALFNSEELAELLGLRLGDLLGEQLAALFNDRGMIEMSAHPDFVRLTLGELHRRHMKVMGSIR